MKGYGESCGHGDSVIDKCYSVTGSCFGGNASKNNNPCSLNNFKKWFLFRVNVAMCAGSATCLVVLFNVAYFLQDDI